EARRADNASNGGEGDDAAARTCQRWKRVLDAEEGACEIHADGVLEGRTVQFGKRCRVADASTGQQYVEVAEAFYRARNNAFTVVVLGPIEPLGGGVLATSARRLLDARTVHVCIHDSGALGDEEIC